MIVQFYTQLVHIPNNPDLKGQATSSKTECLTAHAVSVKFRRKCVFELKIFQILGLCLL